MTECWLVRAQLRDGASPAALAPLLVPSDPNARVGASHRLIWSLLTDGPDRRRDFLWRQTGPAAWIALTRRPPGDYPDLFEVESKPFAPVLRDGQRLGFSLRVNPVRAEKPDPSRRRGRGKRVDVVTHALAGVPTEQRSDARDAAVRAWMRRQGDRNGFALEPDRLRVDAEDWVQLPRPGGGRMTFCAVTVEGVLTVRDPAAFLGRLCDGFGAARAFGCGLMLIRPAPAFADIEDAEDDRA